MGAPKIGYGQGDVRYLASSPGSLQTQTIGARLREASANAHYYDAFQKPYMLSIPPWQPLTEYCAYSGEALDACVKDGNIYKCISGTGLSGTTGPSGTFASSGGGASSDGSVFWTYTGPNIVTQDPSTPITAYSSALTVTANQRILTAAGGVYGCTTGGITSATGSGPTATTGLITDGTAVFVYMGVAYTSPYIGSMPTISTGTTQPGASTVFFWAKGQTFAAVSAQTIAGGTGYHLGDAITSTGGTATTQATWVVTGVSGTVATSVALVSGGAYTVLPSNPITTTTTGSGSGCTLYVRWPDPYWATLYGGYNAGLASSGNANFGNIAVFQPAPGATPIQNYIGGGFSTNGAFVSMHSFAGDTASIQVMMDQRDGKGWVRLNQSAIQSSTNSGDQWITLTPVGGQKWRDYKIENLADAGKLPAIAIPNAATIRPYVRPNKLRLAILSDSIVAGSGWSPFFKGFNVAQRLAKTLGIDDVWIFAQGGAGYVNQGTSPGVGSDNFGYRIPELVTCKPDVVALFGSTNDNGLSGLSATVTATLTSLRTNGYTGPIIVYGVWSVSATSNTTETSVKAGVTAFVDPFNNTFFIPVCFDTTMPWIMNTYNNNPTPAGVTGLGSLINFSTYINSNDSVHPCDLGAEHCALEMADTAIRQVYPFVR